jgi:peptidoglycan/xylan/chitin deacetylase (PgdA/CDA1 family)
VIKHRLKLALREAWARALFHTGLHRLVDRLQPRRLTILFGHAVDAPEHNAGLPGEMKIRGERLRELLEALGRRYELCTLSGGVEALRTEPGGGRSLVALTLDDGYRDNRTALLPLLERVGAPVTVFLETRPLDERRVSWSHKYFWCLGRMDAEALARRYLVLCDDAAAAEGLRRLLEEPDRLEYRVKRLLKYDADAADRDRVLDAIFTEAGGDERALCEALYLDWDDARALAEAGVELGGHTVRHEVLSRLSPDEARAELEACRNSMAAQLPGWEPRVFAYPFGRRWDYDEGTREALRAGGWSLAVNTHAGTNGPDSPPLDLRRIPIDDHTPLHLLVAEACGGFDLARWFGLDLSE